MAKPIRHYGKWRIRWIDEFGNRQSEIYDDYKDAARILREREHHVDEVKIGNRAPTPPKKGYDDIAEYWLKYRAVHKRSRYSDESIIRKHLRPAFGGQPLNQNWVERVDAFVAERVHLHKNTIHHLLTLLISQLRVAHELGWIRQVPRIKKPKIKLFDRDYQYLRTRAEISRFLRAARDEGELAFALYATAVFTGMRQGELAGLRWDDVDFERRIITVRFSWEGPTKNEETRFVPVLDALLPILREWRLRCSGTLVFPTRDATMYARSARIFQETFHRVLEAGQFPKSVRHGKERPYIRFHDLRHTFASHWVMDGGDIFKLQKILGHKSMVMTERYAHLAPNAYEGDLGRLGDVTTVPGKIVPFGATAPVEVK